MSSNPQPLGGAAPPAPPSGISPTAPANLITFALDKVAPPSTLLIQRDDVLILQCATSFTGEQVTFNIRLLLADGSIKPIQTTLTPPNTAATVTQTISLAEGYLLSASAKSLTAGERGFTYARAFINRGAFGTGQPGLVLFADYVTNQLNVSYPNGRILQSTESAGGIARQNPANPTVGNDFAITVPTGFRWRIICLQATLAASAAVANRVPKFAVTFQGTPVFQGPVATAITASQTVTANWAPGTLSVSASLVSVEGPIPENLVLTEGAVLGTVTDNIQAGDQWSNIGLLIEQWLMHP